ncbi:MAG: class I SAM-dependent methyltransferase [Candidatus Rokubacteria bacterium]|nr:class I SAM-dependent methyltransferase [Candidatus Rokubacteria bacterium]
MPLLRRGETLTLIAREPRRRGDLVLACVDGEPVIAWALAPREDGLWRLQPLGRRRVPVSGHPRARVTRVRKREGELDLDRAPWRGRLVASVCRRASGATLLAALWKLAHPVWPPVRLGVAEALRAQVHEAYARPESVTFYERVPPALDPDEAGGAACLGPGSRVLDVGCGAGREAVALARLGHRVTAIDALPAMVVAARRRAGTEGLPVQVLHAAAEAFSAPAASFDAVCFSPNVYSYLPGRAQRVALLRRLAAMLVPGGVLLLVQDVSSRCLLGRSRLTDILRPIARALGVRDVAEPGDGWTTEGTYGLAFKHEFFSCRPLLAELRDGGFHVERVVGTCWVCRRD